MEFVDCHREVHPVQMQAVVSSLPSNLLVRKTVADLLGGFPEDRAFRGKAAGEDVSFKKALNTWFKVVRCAEKFLRYRVKRGSHFDYFLDRSKVVEGKIVFTDLSPEEVTGEKSAARKLYLDQFAQKVSAVASIANFSEGIPPLTNRLIQDIANYDALRSCLETIEGLLHPEE